MPSFTLDQENLARAIKRFIGFKHGWVFYPSRITASSFQPPDSVEIEIDSEVLAPPEEKGSFDLDEMVHPQVCELSESDIAHALSMEINIFHRGKPYDGNRIRFEHLPDFLTFPVKVRIEFVPMGSTFESHPNVFGGL